MPMEKMLEFMQKYKESYRDVTKELLVEATVDFPRGELDVLVWNKLENGSYIIREDVKMKILRFLDAYPGEEKLYKLASEVHVVGSIGTNLYAEDTDIDVHIVPKVNMLPANESDRLALQKSIKDWSHENPMYIGEHPVELYLQLIPEQEMIGDAVYDLMKDVWKKGPRIEGLEYNPYEAFASVMTKVQDYAKKADVELGELKRDVIDFDVLRGALSRLPVEYKKLLKDDLERKLEEIESDIRQLLKTKKVWVDLRHKASRPTKEEALNDIELSKKWQDINATFKFLNRYHYIKTISALEELMADEQISATEVNTIRDVLAMGGK